MFYATTKLSSKVKAVFDLIFQNSSIACLIIDADGIHSDNVNTQCSLIEIDLPSTSFDEYTFTFSAPQYIGLAMHVGQFFRNVKNKSTIIFKIDKPFVLDVECHHPNDSSFALSANIETVQNVERSVRVDYDVPPIRVNSNVVAQMCKSFKHTHIDVIKRDGQVLFSDIIENISTKTWTFGPKNADDKELYFAKFRSDQFMRVMKMASFADDKIDIFVKAGLPVALRTSSKLGTISVLIRPNE